MLDKTRKSAKTATAKDRRSHPRYKFVAAAEMTEKQSRTKVEARVSDVGQFGCFVDTANPFPLGTIVSVRITKGAKSFETDARVVCSTADKGMGLFFTSIAAVHREILAEWIDSSLETSWLASTRRQSQRILVKLRVHVRGKNSLGSPFEEATFTQTASAHGGLILLAAPVNRGQHIIMSNERTNESVECIVAHIGKKHSTHVQVGVAFTLPNPGFWNATFPPEEWTVRHPDAKSKSSVT